MLLKVYLKVISAFRNVRNERGDLNIQYLGIAALSILVIAAVLVVGRLISTKWDALKDTIDTIPNTPIQ